MEARFTIACTDGVGREFVANVRLMRDFICELKDRHGEEIAWHQVFSRLARGSLDDVILFIWLAFRQSDRSITLEQMDSLIEGFALMQFAAVLSSRLVDAVPAELQKKIRRVASEVTAAGPTSANGTEPSSMPSSLESSPVNSGD